MLVEQRKLFICLLIVLVLGLTACLGGGRAPVYSREDQTSAPAAKNKAVQKTIPRSVESEIRTRPLIRKDYYEVVRGDTLYSIAWRYKLDYKTLAKWNVIRSPYLIHVGRKLRLTPSPVKPVQAVKKTTPYPKSKPPLVTERPKAKSKPAVKQSSTIKQPPKLPAKIARWQWPTKGKLISSNTVSARNGIDIKGEVGQTIRAAAAGNVVYSGNGLVGYGNLIIIKHNKTFLSAYAHNNHLLVKEGSSVVVGQPIAEMGSTGTNIVKLHFEIRKDGRSVAPLKYLPK